MADAGHGYVAPFAGLVLARNRRRLRLRHLDHGCPD